MQLVFRNTYPLDSDLCGGKRYPAFEQLKPGLKTVVENDILWSEIGSVLLENWAAYPPKRIPRSTPLGFSLIFGNRFSFASSFFYVLQSKIIFY